MCNETRADFMPQIETCADCGITIAAERALYDGEAYYCPECRVRCLQCGELLEPSKAYQAEDGHHYCDTSCAGETDDEPRRNLREEP